MGKRTDQTPQSIAAAVRPLAEEIIAATPYFLVDVEVRGHWGSRVVEVFIDGEGDFGLDDLATISRELGFLLDVEDTVDGKYKLEVSSPGADRPLTLPQQFRKHVGRELRVRYHPETGGSDKIEGKLVEAGEGGVAVARPEDEPLRIPYAAIEEAVVLLPW